MRLGILTTSFPRHQGDVAGTFVLGLARALAARGHTVEVLAPEPHEAPAPPSWPGITLRWVPYLRPRAWERTFYGAGVPDNLRDDARAWLGLAPFAGAFALAAKRAAANWDAIMSHWALPSACAAALARGDRPHLAAFHSADVHLLERLPGRARVAAWIAGGATTLVFVSHAQRARFIEWLPPTLATRVAARTHVQSMGVDAPPNGGADREPEREAARWAHGVERFMLLSMGRLVPVKGLVAAARAIAPLDHVEWWIAGDGPERDALSRIAATSQARIRLVGEVHGAAKEVLFRAADALLVPSRVLPSGRTEGAPTVIAEAFARGVPVIATDVGGIPELVRHEINGLLVDAADPHACATAVERLRHDDALRMRLAAQARTDGVTLTWNALAPRFEAWLSPDADGKAARATRHASPIAHSHRRL